MKLRWLRQVPTLLTTPFAIVGLTKPVAFILTVEVLVKRNLTVLALPATLLRFIMGTPMVPVIRYITCKVTGPMVGLSTLFAIAESRGW